MTKDLKPTTFELLVRRANLSSTSQPNQARQQKVGENETIWFKIICQALTEELQEGKRSRSKNTWRRELEVDAKQTGCSGRELVNIP